MKLLRLILAIFILLSISCKKESLSIWNENEIVKTDENGNILSNGSPNDWTDQSFSSDANFYDMQQSACRAFYSHFNGYDTEGCLFSANCTENTNFSVVLYPNPVPNGQTPKVRITSSKKMVLIGMGNKIKGVEGIASVASLTLPVPTYETDLEIIDFDFLYGNDIELYLTIMTEDSCITYTKGKVKYL